VKGVSLAQARVLRLWVEQWESLGEWPLLVSCFEAMQVCCYMQ
jgi:hypothetical protein